MIRAVTIATAAALLAAQPALAQDAAGAPAPVPVQPAPAAKGMSLERFSADLNRRGFP